jgi:hypothetical protein
LGAIFISYRRSDSQGEAGRLFEELIRHFGVQAVFMDVVAIDAGRDFRKAIDLSLANCGVLLTMTGPEWLNAVDEHGNRRLDSDNDYVRLEIAAALRRDIPVVPVLLRGAKVPRAEHLPTDIADLAYRNAIELRHARWKSDVQVLIKALRPLVSGDPNRTAGEPPPTIDVTSVQRITRELSIYIGPIAEIVVRRTASRCSSAEELCRKVAAEIDTQSDREQFLSSVRASLTPTV